LFIVVSYRGIARCVCMRPSSLFPFYSRYSAKRPEDPVLAGKF
jgi:hypothetical protein